MKRGYSELSFIVSLILLLALLLFLPIVQAKTLKVTSEHPFLVNSEWIPASDLKVGDTLKTFDGKTARITGIKDVVSDEVFPVYNLEASPFSDFVVEDGLVVHNSNADDLIVLNNNFLNDVRNGKLAIEKELYVGKDYKIIIATESKELEDAASLLRDAYARDYLNALKKGKASSQLQQELGMLEVGKLSFPKIINGVGDRRTIVLVSCGRIVATQSIFESDLSLLVNKALQGTKLSKFSVYEFGSSAVALRQKISVAHRLLSNNLKTLPSGKGVVVHQDLTHAKLMYRYYPEYYIPINFKPEEVGLIVKASVARQADAAELYKIFGDGENPLLPTERLYTFGAIKVEMRDYYGIVLDPEGLSKQAAEKAAGFEAIGQ